MAGAADVTIAEVDEIVELGALDPECIITPAPYVQRVVVRPTPRMSSWTTPC
jgi:acyl CoA:acetate/3-ketoacid CoA transferase alpha subunit